MRLSQAAAIAFGGSRNNSPHDLSRTHRFRSHFGQSDSRPLFHVARRHFTNCQVPNYGQSIRSAGRCFYLLIFLHIGGVEVRLHPPDRHSRGALNTLQQKRAPEGALFWMQAKITSSTPICISPTIRRPRSANTTLHPRNRSDVSA